MENQVTLNAEHRTPDRQTQSAQFSGSLNDFLSGLTRNTRLTATDARVVSLKVLALALLRQLEKLENEMSTGIVTPFDLQEEVRSFEASLIRSALFKTGGRQRIAARLLGMKVTTLNTKIKRLAINS